MSRYVGIESALQFGIVCYIAVAHRILYSRCRATYRAVFLELQQAAAVIEEAPADEVEASAEFASEFFGTLYVGNLLKEFVSRVEVGKFQVGQISSIAHFVNAQESDGKYIEVTGSSEIEVVPDEIHFLIQIKEYWQEEYTGKSNKEEDFRTKVPLAMIEKDLRRSLRKIGIADDAIRTQEIGDYWRQRGKEFLIGKQLDIRLTDFEQINSIIRSVNTWGIESMRIGELKHKDLLMYRKQGKIEALKAAREKASYLVEAMGQELGEVIRIVEPVDNNISRYLPFQAQSNVSMGTAATEQYRVIKLRYEMTARFAIK